MGGPRHPSRSAEKPKSASATSPRSPTPPRPRSSTAPSKNTPRDTPTPSTRPSSAPACCSPGRRHRRHLPDIPEPKTPSASPGLLFPALTQAQPDRFPPANPTRLASRPGPRTPRQGNRSSNAANTTSPSRSRTRVPPAARPPSAHQTSSTPPPSTTSTRHRRKPPRSAASSVPRRDKGVSHQLQQPGRQPPRQTDDCLRATAQPVIPRRQQPPPRMKISEPGVRITLRVLLTAAHRAQPHNAIPPIDPGRTTERPGTQAIHHRLDEGKNTPLPLAETPQRHDAAHPARHPQHRPCRRPDPASPSPDPPPGNRSRDAHACPSPQRRDHTGYRPPWAAAAEQTWSRPTCTASSSGSHMPARLRRRHPIRLRRGS